MMRPIIVKSQINGIPTVHSCHLCGFYSLNVGDYTEHTNKYHKLRGYEWKMHEVTHPTNTATKYWILQPEITHG
jgi:hypothetical protein